MDKSSEEYQESLELCRSRGKGVERLLEIMKRLRDKDNGCPWDLEQNYHSLISSVIEEAYEVVEAIESNNAAHLKEELGDLLFGIVFLSQLASEDREFSFYSVVEDVSDKMVRRHPHIFSDDDGINTVEDQIINWEKLKQLEREHSNTNKSNNLKNSRLPGLLLGKKWYQSEYPKINEQAELKENIAEVKKILGKLSPASSKTGKHINFLLMGEILYNMVKTSRCISVDPEAALKNAIKSRSERIA